MLHKTSTFTCTPHICSIKDCPNWQCIYLFILINNFVNALKKINDLLLLIKIN